jgi:DNA-directed RNA polymerase sigma subunit (sigma70/sigma32)
MPTETNLKHFLKSSPVTKNVSTVRETNEETASLKQEKLEMIKERLFNSLKHLSSHELTLLLKRYGINGYGGTSQADLAQELNVSEETVEAIEAEALRVLMGYPKKPREVKEIPEQ